MLIATLGSAMIYFIASEVTDVKPHAPGTVYYSEVANSKGNITMYHHTPVVVKPLSNQKFKGVVKQAYDYSCGSAALTTVLNGFIGTKLTERQTMNGLLRFGEKQRIIQRRAFSLLDMKRFVTALGFKSGGFKGTLKDLKELDVPVIVRISYSGFNHFVVYKGSKDGRVFVADPALGNISFLEDRFDKYWENKTLFMITPPDKSKISNLLKVNDSDLRVVDDQTINYNAFQQVALPSYREEQLADNAKTMQRVLDADPKSDTFEKNIDIPMKLFYRRK